MTQVIRIVKISITITIILLSMTLKALSQTTYLKLMANDIYTNLNYGSLNNGLQPYKKNAKGFQAGLSFQAGITPKFSLATEAYFSMKGSVLKADNPLTTNKSLLRLYTIEVPVLARFHFGPVYINTGPYVAYNLSGRMKTEGTEALPEKSTRLSFDNSSGGFKRWDMGLQAGAGYNFHIKKASFTLDFRYGYGLTTISRDSKRYNRTISIGIVAINPWKKNPLRKK